MMIRRLGGCRGEAFLVNKFRRMVRNLIENEPQNQAVACNEKALTELVLENGEETDRWESGQSKSSNKFYVVEKGKEVGYFWTPQKNHKKFGGQIFIDLILFKIILFSFMF